MQLPGPLRASVGLIAMAADEAKRLPDRAIELPMLAVSTALQMSLRAQQRYARLTARGDEILHSRHTGEEPPPWATFDEPVGRVEPTGGRPADADVFLDDHGWPTPEDEDAGPGDAAGELLRSRFGRGSDASADRDADADDDVHNADEQPARKTTPRPARKAARKAPAKRPTRKATAKKAIRAVEAVEAAADQDSTDDPTPGKDVHPPRHIPPSRFDIVGDDPSDDPSDD